MLVMIPVFSSIVLADSETMFPCQIGDNELIAPCIGDTQLQDIFGLDTLSNTSYINILHDNIFTNESSKTFEITQILFDINGSFITNESVCNISVYMLNGTYIINNELMIPDESGIQRYTYNFTGSPLGLYTAYYYCIYNNTYSVVSASRYEEFRVISPDMIIGYTIENIAEFVDDNISLLIGVIFIFIGTVYIYNVYKHKTYKKYKYGE